MIWSLRDQWLSQRDYTTQEGAEDVVRVGRERGGRCGGCAEKSLKSRHRRGPTRPQARKSCLPDVSARYVRLQRYTALSSRHMLLPDGSGHISPEPSPLAQNRKPTHTSRKSLDFHERLQLLSANPPPTPSSSIPSVLRCRQAQLQDGFRQAAR